MCGRYCVWKRHNKAMYKAEHSRTGNSAQTCRVFIWFSNHFRTFVQSAPFQKISMKELNKLAKVSLKYTF